MRNVLFMALIASSFIACNEREIVETEELTGENTVTLSLKQNPLSRGVSDQKGDTEYAVIGSGKIFFINSSGSSIYQRDLTSTEIAALSNTSTTPGNKTVTITGVPNTATTLFFMANVQTSAGAGFPTIDGTTAADARLRIDKLQANAINVPMSGQSLTFTNVSGNNYIASVILTPIVARIELGQISCHNQNGEGQPAINSDITGYKLSGVFVNSTRQDVLLSGTPYLVSAPMDIRSQAGWSNSWAVYFTSINTNFPYYIGGSPAGPSDWVANALSTYCTPSSAALSFYPDPTTGATNIDPVVTPKRAWAYQVCPSTTVAVGSPADVPHLILKLIEVTYEDNSLSQSTQYLTVTKYQDPGGTPVTEFKRGNIYRIQNLKFSANESTNQPYEKNINVTATVTVAPWVINNVKPDWN